MSYLVSPTANPNLSIEIEAFPGRRGPTDPWQWRVVDPATGRDSLVMVLPSFPTRIRWDPDFTHVEYVIADRIERAAWRIGARPHELARLPAGADTSLCDFWVDRAGGVHVALQETRPGEGGFVKRILTRWDRGSDGTWRAAAADSAEEGFGGCLGSDGLAGADRRTEISMRVLLDSMLVYHQRTIVLSEAKGSAYEDDEWLAWAPSALDSAIGIEVKVGMGDSPHAMEPIVWVDRKRRRRVTVCPEGCTRDETSGQVGFAERLGFLLVTAEYVGAYPNVIDVRAGRVVFRETRPSARAVWVPAPR